MYQNHDKRNTQTEFRKTTQLEIGGHGPVSFVTALTHCRATVYQNMKA